MTQEDVEEFARLNKKNIIGWGSSSDEKEKTSKITYTLTDMVDYVFVIRADDDITFSKKQGNVHYHY